MNMHIGFVKYTKKDNNKSKSSFFGGTTDWTSGMTGNVSGLVVFFASHNQHCIGKTTLIEGGILKGTLSCPKYKITDALTITAKVR